MKNFPFVVTQGRYKHSLEKKLPEEGNRKERERPFVLLCWVRVDSFRRGGEGGGKVSFSLRHNR